MLLLLIILVLLFGGLGGHWGYHNYGGYYGGAGIGLGTVLVILLVAYLLGAFRQVRLTTREHLVDLIRSVQHAMQENLDAGRFTAANELRTELAWLSTELAQGFFSRPGGRFRA